MCNSKGKDKVMNNNARFKYIQLYINSDRTLRQREPLREIHKISKEEKQKEIQSLQASKKQK